MKLTGSEQDSLAANCGECWARPGQKCRVVRRDHSYGPERGHPHPARIRRAKRRGLLGGVGRAMLPRIRDGKLWDW